MNCESLWAVTPSRWWATGAIILLLTLTWSIPRALQRRQRLIDANWNITQYQLSIAGTQNLIKTLEAQVLETQRRVLQSQQELARTRNR